MDYRIEKNKKKWIGQKNMSTQGQTMEIIEYFNNKNITVKIIEDGTIIKNKRLDHFLNGNIENPNFVKGKIKKNNLEKFIGMTNIADCGMEMTIIAYDTSRHVIVQFKDGTIKKTDLSHFKAGRVGNPNISRQDIKRTKCGQKYIGLEYITTDGFKAKVIEYFDYNNVTIQYEDTSIETNVSLIALTNHNFRKNHYVKPDLPEGVCMHPCGLTYRMISYENKIGAIAEFEDGYLTPRIPRTKFANQDFSHPVIMKRGMYKFFTSKNYFGFKIKEEFKMDNDIYYSVNKDDIFVGVMTLQDLLIYMKEVTI